ncbi:hypothetical protein JL720_2348 [Aureococcus anophagefferens]|nr:hypothetical protein JL720_2348 [Aureococcus anophagefferens]
MAEDPAMQADRSAWADADQADADLLAALSAVWSEPLQRLYDRSPTAAPAARERRARRDASGWSTAHEALEHLSPDRACARRLPEVLAALRDHADGGGRIVEAEASGRRALGEAAARVARAEEKRRAMCVARVARVAAGDWTYATAKPLKGATRRRLLEAKLDRGWRVLWELRRDRVVVVWFVVPHDAISRRARQIDAAELRSARPLGDGDDEEVPLDPLGNTPLCCYAVRLDDLPRLVAGDWTPPMALTAPERAVVANDAPSATLLLGRSGTGKTICTVSRMLLDAERFPGETRVFVARSRRLVDHVGRMLKRHGDDGATLATLDDFVAGLAAPATYEPRRRIRSFLKGSAEAVVKGAALEEADFLAEAFNNRTRLRSADDRRDACRIRARYDRELAARGLWDDADRARAVAARLLADRGARAFDRVYVDEVQDSTQAELMVLALACGGDAARLWLAGDTAQAVTYGVHFRFAEVRSALYRCCEAAARAAARDEAHGELPRPRRRPRRRRGRARRAARRLPEALDKLPRDEAMARAPPARRAPVGLGGLFGGAAAMRRFGPLPLQLEAELMLLYTGITRCRTQLLFCEAKTPAGGAFARWLLDRDLAEKFTPPRDDERIFLTRDEWRAPRTSRTGPRAPAAPRRRGGLRARRRRRGGRGGARRPRGGGARRRRRRRRRRRAVAGCLRGRRATPRALRAAPGDAARECRLAILQRCMVGDEARDAADALRDILDLDAQLDGGAAATEYLRVTWDGGDGSDQYGIKAALDERYEVVEFDWLWEDARPGEVHVHFATRADARDAKNFLSSGEDEDLAGLQVTGHFISADDFAAAKASYDDLLAAKAADRAAEEAAMPAAKADDEAATAPTPKPARRLAPPREHLLQSAADGIVSLESFGFTERSVHRAERQILFGVRAPDTSTLDCRACGRIMLPEKFSNREIKRKQGARCKDCQAADLLAAVYSDDKFFDGPLGVLANLMESGGVPMNEDYQRIIGYGVNAARLKTEPVAPWRYAHRKIGQKLDEYGEPSIENPNFFETLAQVRKYLELHGADGVTKTGDIDEAPLTFRRDDANEITDCFDPKGAASFLDRGLRHEHLPRIIELLVNDIAMIISARAPESRPLLKLWVDVAQKAAKGKDAHDSFPTAAATLVASSLRFAKSIGFQGDDDLSSRLITTAGLALRSGRADALAAYQQNDGPKLVAAAEAAGGAGKIAATVFSGTSRAPSTDGGERAAALPATVKCADCSVTAGLCEYAGSKGESFHLCPGCYRYRVTENPAAKFKRVSGAPEAEDRKSADAAACETSVVDFENRRMLATLARLNCNVSPSTKTILREEMIDLDALIACKPNDYAEIGIGAMDQHRLFSIQPTLMKMKESGEGPWELS